MTVGQDGSDASPSLPPVEFAEAFWHSEAMRAELDDPGFTVDDATEVVLERFRVVARDVP